MVGRYILKNLSPSNNDHLCLTFVSLFSQNSHQKRYTYNIFNPLDVENKTKLFFFQPSNERRINMKRARQADNWEKKKQRKVMCAQYGDKVTNASTVVVIFVVYILVELDIFRCFHHQILIVRSRRQNRVVLE